MDREWTTEREREGGVAREVVIFSWQIGLPLGLIPVQACSAPSAWDERRKIYAAEQPEHIESALVGFHGPTAINKSIGNVGWLQREQGGGLQMYGWRDGSQTRGQRSASPSVHSESTLYDEVSIDQEIPLWSLPLFLSVLCQSIFSLEERISLS